MAKKNDDKKIDRVKSAARSDAVRQAERVDKISQVQQTKGVGAVQPVNSAGARRPTRVMSLVEREELFKMISEETDKMVSQGVLPASKKEVIAQAVKMAVDSGLSDSDDDEQEPQS